MQALLSAVGTCATGCLMLGLGMHHTFSCDCCVPSAHHADTHCLWLWQGTRRQSRRLARCGCRWMRLCATPRCATPGRCRYQLLTPHEHLDHPTNFAPPCRTNAESQVLGTARAAAWRQGRASPSTCLRWMSTGCDHKTCPEQLQKFILLCVEGTSMMQEVRMCCERLMQDPVFVKESTMLKCLCAAAAGDAEG